MLYGIVEFLGWFGAVTVLAGYILFSTGKLPNGPLYQSFNLVGGLAVAINVGAHHAIPSTIVNGIWALVAVVVLVRTGRARRAAKRGVPTAAAEPALLVEPPATTAVLPVVGPALRDHEADATDATDAAPRLQSATTRATDATDAAPRLQSTATEATHATDAAPTAAAPMTESLPVITATIALALVAAAQEHAEAQHQEHAEAQHQEHAEAQHQERAGAERQAHAGAERREHDAPAAPPEPHRAESATA